MHDALGFPLWLRITHLLNILFLSLLIRSGIQILFDHPKLYWRDDCLPGSEWLKLSKKEMPGDKSWTSLDEAEDVSSWIALPGGRHNLGLGRDWHFASVLFWVLNGIIYVILLFATATWMRLIPTNWHEIGDAFHTLITYATFHLPPASDFKPYDPLQKLCYAGVVFVLAPLAIFTGIAMSPSIAAKQPWFSNLFGGRQVARSLHFLIMIAYLLFAVVHVILVLIVRYPINICHIVFGDESGRVVEASIIAATALLAIVGVHLLATVSSKSAPNAVHKMLLPAIFMIANRFLSGGESRQNYDEEDISAYFRVNGRPPETPEYQVLSADHFAGYQLKIGGLVENELSLSLEDLRRLPKSSQITKHICIQGWSAIAKWSGVSMADIVGRCRPKANARYVVFHSFETDENGYHYYESLTVDECGSAQVLLAYEMNDEPLPIEHGAPLRLRAEMKLGFKMVKYIDEIQFVESLHNIGLGQGGYKEDHEYYDRVAGL